jgi:hypothetical protein
MLANNFSGHNISYEPRNIQLEFFELNMMLYVQLLDARIIQCFKAHYQCEFCSRALDLNDLGEANIYKINILEAMLLAKSAWAAIMDTTIWNCWDHTQIQLYVSYFKTSHIITHSGTQC